jgi:hypothetical protein
LPETPVLVLAFATDCSLLHFGSASSSSLGQSLFSFRGLEISNLPQDGLRTALRYAISVYFSARFDVAHVISSTSAMLKYVGLLWMIMWRCIEFK